MCLPVLDEQSGKMGNPGLAIRRAGYFIAPGGRRGGQGAVTGGAQAEEALRRRGKLPVVITGGLQGGGLADDDAQERGRAAFRQLFEAPVSLAQTFVMGLDQHEAERALQVGRPPAVVFAQNEAPGIVAIAVEAVPQVREGVRAAFPVPGKMEGDIAARRAGADNHGRGAMAAQGGGQLRGGQGGLAPRRVGEDEPGRGRRRRRRSRRGGRLLFLAEEVVADLGQALPCAARGCLLLRQWPVPRFP